MNFRTRDPEQLLSLVEGTAVFLIFYQALRVLLSVLFGVIYDAIFSSQVPIATAGLMLGAVVLALLAPLAVPRNRRIPQLLPSLASLPLFLARIPMTMGDPQVRLASALVIVAGGMVYLGLRLGSGRAGAIRALVAALVLDQLLRAVGQTLDPTLEPRWLIGQAVVSGALCLLALRFLVRRPAEEYDAGSQIGLPGGLAWGAWLFLQTGALAFPNVVSRWSGVAYALTAPLVLAVTLLGLSEGARGGGGRGVERGTIFLFVVAAGLAAGYLLGGLAALGGLLLVQLVAVVSLSSIFRARAEGERPGTGSGLAAGGILFLLLSFASAFTFTYPYTLPLMRGLGWVVVVVAGLVMALRFFSRPRKAAASTAVLEPSWAVALGLILVMFVLVVAQSKAPSSAGEEATLHVATYNIHYGYDSDWSLALEQQAQAIESSGADVVALQEVDTGRPTSYMVDDAHWLSRRLNMHVAYLPCVEHLTGIALLSRFPILDADTLLLPSELEQTGIVWAQVDVGGTALNAFGVWLGLEPEERAGQLGAALPFLGGRSGPAVFGGDFNSPPGSPVYEGIAGAGFLDPFAQLGLGSPPTSPAVEPEKRIDFVWLREMSPVSARVMDSLASDHRLVVVEAALGQP